MNPEAIVDKALLRHRLRRAVTRKAPGADFLLKRVVADQMERLAAVERRFSRAIAFSGQTSELADAMRATGKVDEIWRFERTDAAFAPGDSGVTADEETLPLASESVDLFVASLALQWTNDLPGALLQIRRALRPDGLLLAAFLGGGTLQELRLSLVQAETELLDGASPRVIPFAELRDIGALLQRSGFALPVVDRDVLTVRYDTAFGLMADLRAMGAASPLADRSRRPTPKALFLRAAGIYGERFSDPDGRIRATFEVISISGWAPHESQQKPARRGSATVSLAAVLESAREKGS